MLQLDIFDALATITPADVVAPLITPRVAPVAPVAVAPVVEIPDFYTFTVHVLGRCAVKRCKRRKRNTLPAFTTTNRYGTQTTFDIPTAFGMISPFSRWDGYTPSVRVLMEHYRSDRDEIVPFVGAMRSVGWICPDHNRVMKIAKIEGAINIDKTCDGRCMSAIGPSCECSCGGENHGARWA